MSRIVFRCVAILTIACASAARSDPWCGPPHGRFSGYEAFGFRTSGFGRYGLFSRRYCLQQGHFHYSAPYYGCYTPYYRTYGVGLVYPPLFVNYGELYGPAAVSRLFAVQQPAAAAEVPIGGGLLRDLPPPNEIDPLAGNPALGWRFIEFGDKRFRNGEYHRALQRYKKASDAARGLADASFRQAIAHMALGKYDRATAAIQQGLHLQPDWPGSRVRLDDLYGAAADKLAHRAMLDDWLAEHPLDANAHFLRGVLLHFEGESDQSLAEFHRTLQLTGIEDHVKAFLPPPAPNAAE